MLIKIFIIAEAGVNHDGKVEVAKELISVARDSGADAVKFQTGKAKNVISKFAPKAEYQKVTTGEIESQLEMGKKLELNEAQHVELINDCSKKGITFLSTPYDLGSVDLLNGLGLETLKIPSGEITNLPYLRKIGSLRKKIIMSTGMANLEEIRAATNILTGSGTPKENITILHCNSEYPTPIEDVNLNAMYTIRDELGVKVGYSDHTLGIEVAIAAVAMGASVIEKHFTLNRNLPGPDHCASLEPDELKAMVKAIRLIEKAMGDGVKQPSQSEKKNIPIVRKSIVAARKIKIGETFTEVNLTTKRPGNGISPIRWDEIIGKRAIKNYQPDDFITDSE